MSRSKKPELADLRSLIGKAVPRKEVYERLESRRITGDWATVVGEYLASRSAPESFDHGLLTIAVSSAPWAQELRLRKSELLKRLNEVAGRDLFTDLKVNVKNPKASPIAEKPKEGFKPVDADVVVTNPDIPEVVECVIGRLRSAAKRKK